MNLTILNLPKAAKLSSKVGRVGAILSKYKPEILLVGGIGATITGTILACKAYKESQNIIEYHKENIKDENKYYEEQKDTMDPDFEFSPETLKDFKKRHGRIVFEIYKDTGIELAKIYAPAVSTYTFGVFCICAGFGIMRQRYVTTMAAYGVLEKAFDKYRGRIKTLLGEDMEKAIYNGEKVEMDIYNDKGKKVGTNVVESEENALELAPYAVYWDRSTSASYRENREYAHTFLYGIEKNMNELLLSKGHLTLNEVYNALGLEETATGAICGWLITEDYPSETDWDNVVKFDIKEECYTDWEEGMASIRTGRNPVQYRIDFNCDGIIWDKIGIFKGV